MKRLFLLLLLLVFPTSAQAVNTPTGVTALASATNIAVSWYDNTDTHTGYKLYRQTLLRDGTWTPTAPGTLLLTREGMNHSHAYLDLSVKRLTTYRYSVKACLVCGVSESAASTLAGAAVPPFAYDSPWNRSVASSIGLTNTQATDVGGSTGIDISGTPANPTYAAPVYFGESGDGSTSTFTGDTSWSPTAGNFIWDSNPITIPASGGSPAGPAPVPEHGGTAPEYTDGHLVIADATRTKVWEFWNVREGTTPNISTGFTMGDVGGDPGIRTQISLTGPGYNSTNTPGSNGLGWEESSARGSGVPLVDTAVRCEEAYYGINHAIGFTVPNDIAAWVDGSGSRYTYPPATHSDGNTLLGSTHLRYGDRLRLDPTITPTGSIGRQNLIRALQTYGAFVVDQGGITPTLDAFSSNDPGGFCALAGVDSGTLSGISANKFQLVTGVN